MIFGKYWFHIEYYYSLLHLCNICTITSSLSIFFRICAFPLNIFEIFLSSALVSIVTMTDHIWIWTPIGFWPTTGHNMHFQSENANILDWDWGKNIIMLRIERFFSVGVQLFTCNASNENWQFWKISTQFISRTWNMLCWMALGNCITLKVSPNKGNL